VAITPAWAQLCQIARHSLQPGMDDSAWAEAIKQRIATLGFSRYPTAGDITLAMRAIEATYHRALPPPT